MTDPQDDVPCRACETEGPRARLDDDGVCRRCRENPFGVLSERPARAAMVDTLRQIATAIGTPAHVDPLADLPGLVMMVQAVVQRAESSAIVAGQIKALEVER